MSVKDLEKAVSALKPAELKEFRSWFADFDMALWDKQIEEDSIAGRLDHLVKEAMENYRAGESTDL